MANFIQKQSIVLNSLGQAFLRNGELGKFKHLKILLAI